MRTIISVVTDANDRDGAIWGESRDGDAPVSPTELDCVRFV
jgi:hypothetical protein